MNIVGLSSFALLDAHKVTVLAKVEQMENSDIEQFIVEKRPILWDKTSDLYKDRNKKRSAWDEVCNLFIPNYSELPDNVKNEKGKVVKIKFYLVARALNQHHS